MLSLNIHQLGETTVFQCAGRIVFGECDILRAAVLARPHCLIAVLDMAEVTAMDAAGLGMLVELRNWAWARRTELKLLNLTPYMEELLQKTNLARRFDVCSARDMVDLLGRAIQLSTTPHASASTSAAQM